MNYGTILPLLVTVVLALIGYAITYQHNIRISQRKDRLDRINRQLSEFYGPLLSLYYASNRAAEAFIILHQRGYGEDLTHKPKDDFVSAESAAHWELWAREVFMPLNTQMLNLIINKADLIRESEMPEVLLDLSAHVSAYKGVLKQWEMGDHSERWSHIGFPGERLNEYVVDGFRSLKHEQVALLGAVERGARRPRCARGRLQGVGG